MVVLEMGGIAMSKPQKSISLLVGSILVTIGIILLLVYFFLVAQPGLPADFGTIEGDLLVRVRREDVPRGSLYITQERKDYQSGTMRLIIPAIGVDTAVGSSTKVDALAELPGLYEVAQMPGTGDRNTSIAGHRDIYDQVFYTLDKLQDQDALYLIYGQSVYIYQYERTLIVPPDDWSVVASQGYSLLTLTTCDPIGTTLNRLIVQARLVDITAYRDTSQFADKIPK